MAKNKFTKRRRHKLYKELRIQAQIAHAGVGTKVLTGNECSYFVPIGLFHLVHWHLEDNGLADPNDFQNVMNWFPELLEHKPEHATPNSYWWPRDDWDVRIEVLEQAIELTA